MIEIENLTEKEINQLKDLSKYCYNNESDFRTRISLRVVSRIQEIGLNTRWEEKSSVLEYKEYASKLIRLWFPYMTADRVAEEVQNVRTKNTININLIVREMMQLYRQFN